MKRLMVIVIVTTAIGTSLASILPIGNIPYGKPITTEMSAKTVTKNELGYAKLKRIQTPKILRSNPYRLSHFLNATDDDEIEISDDAKITSYRKRDFGKVKVDPSKDDPEGLFTEDIRWKLFLARQAALLVHQEKWG